MNFNSTAQVTNRLDNLVQTSAVVEMHSQTSTSSREFVRYESNLC
jgi:hypothetical protein